MRAEGSVGGDDYVYSTDRGDVFTENTYTLISRPTGCSHNMRIVWYANHSSIKGFKHLVDF